MDRKNVNVRHYSIRQYGRARETLLHHWIRLSNNDNNDKAVRKRLLEYGADISATYRFGKSLLHLAVSFAFYEITEWLLNNGAYVDSQKINKDTPLHIAADGNIRLCTLLLIRGADPNSVNKNGEIPLSLAAKSTHTKIVKLLLSYGGDATRIEFLGRKTKDELDSSHCIRYWCEQNISNSEGNTFICTAI